MLDNLDFLNENIKPVFESAKGALSKFTTDTAEKAITQFIHGNQTIHAHELDVDTSNPIVVIELFRHKENETLRALFAVKFNGRSYALMTETTPSEHKQTVELMTTFFKRKENKENQDIEQVISSALQLGDDELNSLDVRVKEIFNAAVTEFTTVNNDISYFDWDTVTDRIEQEITPVSTCYPIGYKFSDNYRYCDISVKLKHNGNIHKVAYKLCIFDDKERQATAERLTY